MRPLFFIFSTFILQALANFSDAQISQAVPPSAPLLSPKVETARISALETQTACMRFVQMNVFEFEECIGDRLHNKQLNTAERLGITYMGLVGAMSAQRMGSQGSHRMAWVYAHKTLKLQKKLGLQNKQLCDVVPGDCETRMARTELILKEPAPAHLTESEIATVHRH